MTHSLRPRCVPARHAMACMPPGLAQLAGPQVDTSVIGAHPARLYSLRIVRPLAAQLRACRVRALRHARARRASRDAPHASERPCGRAAQVVTTGVVHLQFHPGAAALVLAAADKAGHVALWAVRARAEPQQACVRAVALRPCTPPLAPLHAHAEAVT